VTARSTSLGFKRPWIQVDPGFDPLLTSFQATSMVTFTSFPNPKDSFSYAPPKFSAEDKNDMDIDVYEDDDDGEDFDSGTKLTCPGEPITSSHAYMRYAVRCML
jgi:hypothetical protein